MQARKTAKRLWSGERALELPEYAIMFGLITLAILIVIQILIVLISSWFQAGANALSGG